MTSRLSTAGVNNGQALKRYMRLSRGAELSPRNAEMASEAAGGWEADSNPYE